MKHEMRRLYGVAFTEYLLPIKREMYKVSENTLSITKKTIKSHCLKED